VKSIAIPDALTASVKDTDSGILDAGVTVRPGDAILPLRSTSERAGFLVATGETLQEAAARADRGCRQIAMLYADGTTRHAAELVEFRELAHS